MNIRVFQGEPGIKAFFTTRKGGVSTVPYDTLNFGGSTSDLPQNTAENRRRALEEAGVSGIVVRPFQVHGDRIACITKEYLEQQFASLPQNLREEDGGHSELPLEGTDGMVTNCKNVVLTTVHGDCLAVFLADSKNGVIGLVHAGWRGTLSGIAKKAVSMMVDLGGKHRNIAAFISPGISKCCFLVGKEVYQEFFERYSFMDEFAVPKERNKYLLDLKGINGRQLAECGIEQIEVSPLCTFCEKDLFFSYRRDAGKTGRMGAGICLCD